MSDSLWPHGLYSPWNSPGQNTGVGSLSLLQGIFPTQGSNPGLPHCGQILYLLSHKGSPRILQWVAYPFSRGSSQPRTWTRVSCIASRFFTNWAMREAQLFRLIGKRLQLLQKGGVSLWLTNLAETQNWPILSGCPLCRENRWSFSKWAIWTTVWGKKLKIFSHLLKYVLVLLIPDKLKI